jgi:hypothetical protein
VAIYHYSQKPLSRKSGRSAPAAAAYRAGAKLDGPDGRVHDYTRRRGVISSRVVAPEGASWARDRQQLWTAAEGAEARRDARTAREHEVALPEELSRDDQVALAESFAREIRDAYGVAVDVAVHQGHGDARNVHAHLLATTREATAEGLDTKVAPELSDKKRAAQGLGKASVELEGWRQRWEKLCNEHLAEAQCSTRIDHRSLEAQGISREPAPKMGAAAGMEKRGIQTERGAAWIEVAKRNQDPDHRAQLALERQRRRVDQLEQRAQRAPEAVVSGTRSPRSRAAREVAGLQFNAHERALATVRHEAHAADQRYQHARAQYERFTGVTGLLRSLRHPIQRYRAVAHLEETADAADRADQAVSDEREVGREWRAWARKPDVSARISERAGEIRDGLEARSDLPAARERLHELEQRVEPGTAPDHAHQDSQRPQWPQRPDEDEDEPEPDGPRM